MTSFKNIVQQIYAGVMYIDETRFFSIPEFIEAHHDLAKYKGKIFYKNIKHRLMVSLIELDMNNEQTEIARTYVNTKESEVVKVIFVEPVNEELITRQELMKRLNLSEPTIIKRQKDGSLPYSKVGRRILYDWLKVKAALDSSRKTR